MVPAPNGFIFLNKMQQLPLGNRITFFPELKKKSSPLKLNTSFSHVPYFIKYYFIRENSVARSQMWDMKKFEGCNVSSSTSKNSTAIHIKTPHTHVITSYTEGLHLSKPRPTPVLPNLETA